MPRRGADDPCRRPVRLLRAARPGVGVQAFYHVGRIGTYAVLGASFGAAGSVALLALDAVPLQRAVYIASKFC